MDKGAAMKAGAMAHARGERGQAGYNPEFIRAIRGRADAVALEIAYSEGYHLELLRHCDASMWGAPTYPAPAYAGF